MEKKDSGKQKKSIIIVFSIAILILTFTITIQYDAQRAYENSLENLNTEDLVTIVKSLTERQDSLSAELDQLTILSTSQDNTETMQKQINQLSLITGSVAVSGPGVAISITADSPIVSYDIIDIINELKVSGAEAIAINDHRLTYTDRFNSEVDEKGNTIIFLNGEKLLSPIIITAIGNPDSLDKGLNMVGGIIENLNTLYNVYPQIRQMEKITMPAINVNTQPSFKKPSTATVTTTQTNK